MIHNIPRKLLVDLLLYNININNVVFYYHFLLCYKKTTKKKLFDENDTLCINHIKYKRVFTKGNIRAIKYTLYGNQYYSLNLTCATRDVAASGNHDALELMLNHCMKKYKDSWKKFICEQKIGFLATSIIDSCNNVSFNEICFMLDIYCKYFDQTINELLKECYAHIFSVMDYTTLNGLLVIIQLYESCNYDINKLVLNHKHYIFKKTHMKAYIKDTKSFIILFKRFVHLVDEFKDYQEEIYDHVLKYCSIDTYNEMNNMFLKYYEIDVEGKIIKKYDDMLFVKSLGNIIKASNVDMVKYMLNKRPVGQKLLLQLYIINCQTLFLNNTPEKIKDTMRITDEMKKFIVGNIIKSIDFSIDEFNQDFTSAYNVLNMYVTRNIVNFGVHSNVNENINTYFCTERSLMIVTNCLLMILKYNNDCIVNGKDFYSAPFVAELIALILCYAWRTKVKYTYMLNHASIYNCYFENIMCLLKNYKVPVKNNIMTCDCGIINCIIEKFNF